MTAVLTDLGGEPAGEEPGRTWVAGRFDAPYLRDSMLDAGVLVETLETATYWSRLRADVRRGVGRADARSLGEPAMVLCHVSHVYETGASLYFTVAAPEGDDPLGRWLGAKRAAMDAIVATGATITHHHAVGTDHQPWLEDEIGRGGGRGAAGGQARRSTRAGSSTPACWCPDAGVPERPHQQLGRDSRP